MKLTEKKQLLKEQVEEMGVYFEKFNTPPVASRVLAYLLITDPPYSTFNEIQDFLHASKSSISNALKFLSNDGRIDYYTKSGDRTRYYKVNAELWIKVMQERIIAWNSSSNMLADIIKERRNSSYKEFNLGLRYINDFELFMQNKWKEVLLQWNLKTA